MIAAFEQYSCMCICQNPIVFDALGGWWMHSQNTACQCAGSIRQSSDFRYHRGTPHHHNPRRYNIIFERLIESQGTVWISHPDTFSYNIIETDINEHKRVSSDRNRYTKMEDRSDNKFHSKLRSCIHYFTYFKSALCCQWFYWAST